MAITVNWQGHKLEPHLYTSRAEPDRYGKRGGFRVTPPGDGHNESRNGVYYRSIEDVAEHLLANPDWGVRMRLPNGQTNIFVSDIVINGVPR